MTEDLSIPEHERLVERLQRTLASHHHRVVIAVFTNSLRSVEQQCIRTTWGVRALRAGIPVVFVIGIPQSVTSVRADTISIPLDDSDCMSSNKLSAFLEYARAHWSFDMLLTVSDTSYVHVGKVSKLPEQKALLGAATSIHGTNLIPAAHIRSLCKNLKSTSDYTEMQPFSEFEVYDPEREESLRADLLSASILSVDKLPYDVFSKWHEILCSQDRNKSEDSFSRGLRFASGVWKKSVLPFRIVRAMQTSTDLSSIQRLKAWFFTRLESLTSRIQLKRGPCLFLDCTDSSLHAYGEMLLARHEFVVVSFVQVPEFKVAKQSLAFLHAQQACEVRSLNDTRVESIRSEISTLCESYHYRIIELVLNEDQLSFIEACLAENVFRKCSFVYLGIPAEQALDQYWPLIHQMQRQSRVILKSYSQNS